MALKKRGKFWYGDQHSDIHAEITRYSNLNAYPAAHFADCRCKCGHRLFRVELDDNAGAAVRVCKSCSHRHPIGDSADFMEDAEFGECECPCGSTAFEVSLGVACYQDSNDVKWLYLGFRCPDCKLTSVYGDWKNEFEDYKELLKLA